MLVIVMMLTNLPIDEAVSAEPMFRNTSPLEAMAWLPKTQPDARIRYAAKSALQFGDLRLPAGNPPANGWPLAIFIHGGAWLADFNKDYTNSFVEALTETGVATWDIEYRRLGNDSGGYPGTFADVGSAVDYVNVLAQTYPIDLGRVVAVGHSSGGHLALWVAGRKNLPVSSPMYKPNPLPLAGVVSLAGVNDLERSLELGKRTDVLTLLGVESSLQADSLFAETNPARLLPFGMKQVLIIGTRDNEWRMAMTHEYAANARSAGDAVELEIPEGANHFDVVDPQGSVVAIVSNAILAFEQQESRGQSQGTE